MGKYSLNEGNDELIRSLLLMKYDTKKTLTENEEKIKPLIKEDVPTSAVAGAGLGAAAGLGIANATAVPATTALIAAPTGAAAIIPLVAKTLSVGTVAATGIVGAAVGAALLPLVYWLVTKDTGSKRVKTYFDFCSSSADKVAKLKRKIDNSQIRELSDKINDALNYKTFGFMAGTDEESLFSVFNSIAEGTASDVCALFQYYNNQYGDLWDDLDSDIDSESEWNQIYRPIRNCVEDSMKELENEPKKQCPDGTPMPLDGKCPSKKDNIPVVTSKCPVGNGTRQEVIDFQTYVVNTIKDTSILGRYGANKDGIDGICGPNTKKAWNMYKSKYENKTGSDTTTTNPDEDEDSIADDNMSDIDN